MGQNPVTSPSEQFVKDLRDCLNHLYDPGFLRASPLAAIFNTGVRFDSPSILQNLLIKAVEALRPTASTANKAHAQATYDLLLFRYVQQSSQDEIAGQMGISPRQFRRQQSLAIFELACSLWNQHRLWEAGKQEAAAPPAVRATGAAGKIDRELEWLKSTSSQAATDLGPALSETLALIEPLATQKGVRVICEPAAGRVAAVHPVALQQILLNLLSMAISCAGEPVVRLRIIPRGQEIAIQVSASRHIRAGADADQEIWLAEMGQLAELSHGTFQFGSEGSRVQAEVAFRLLPLRNILVIDDNPEIVSMIQRFTAGTRFQVSGIQDPKITIDQVQQALPDLIILDVMMPQIDGLQLLSRLKHHPQLSRIPVIVCTVLGQEELAYSLGASSFIQKPFQRDTLIDVLNLMA
jgi:CheY-like chemotaxis protein